jgi:hypothetical protein
MVTGDTEAVSSKVKQASSCKEMACKKPKFRKYDTKYPSFGFTYIVVDGEERPQYLLRVIVLALDIMKPNKLNTCLGRVNAE